MNLHSCHFLIVTLLATIRRYYSWWRRIGELTYNPAFMWLMPLVQTCENLCDCTRCTCCGERGNCWGRAKKVVEYLESTTLSLKASIKKQITAKGGLNKSRNETKQQNKHTSCDKILYRYMLDTLQIDTGCSTPTSDHISTNCTDTELKHVWLITCWPSWTQIRSVAANIWWLSTWVGRTNSHSVSIEGKSNVVPRNSEWLSWVIELHSRSGRRQWVCTGERNKPKAGEQFGMAVPIVNSAYKSRPFDVIASGKYPCGSGLVKDTIYNYDSDMFSFYSMLI